MNNFIKDLNNSLYTGFIDKSFLSGIEYQPELLFNQKYPPQKILTNILSEFDKCNKFYISVAFATTSGVAAIINKLKELENRNVKGKILVSQYLNFTQPEALKRLIQFSNIELRIATQDNSHIKSFIFNNDLNYNIIVGSSNLTANALSTNKEWNLKVSAHSNSSIVNSVINEFDKDFEKGVPVNNEFISQYEKIYIKKLIQENIIEDQNQLFNQNISVIPNSMQKEALQCLEKLRNQHKNKALIISATGTGKTYLSAFDAKQFNPNRLLFVVHRETIAKDALNTFLKVFGNTKTFGLYTGNNKDINVDFLFSTIQTISKSNHFEKFSKDHFDYIIIDESHRSGAESYDIIINYFKPKFLLGMTATPDRTDGRNIFKNFDHNIAFDIRLSRALEEDLLCPFHYYGITDLIVDNSIIENKSDFRHLISSERVDRIIDQSKFYGTDNGVVRGLVFCSRKNEAIELSEIFNTKGFKTMALTAESGEKERELAINLLESDDFSQKLDYIFTVDIFNEGIDIPKINQIILLRPTESSIIFIQQLGRGLRKAKDKSYLTIIDFIGNYEKNYLIPIALFGDSSYNKDKIRKLLSEGSKLIPGASTINFDEISKDRIFKSIDSANLKLYNDLKNDFNLLKFKLGKTPLMMDFILNDYRDPFLFVEYAGSFYNFVKKVDVKEELLSLSQIKLLELFSREINNTKRLEESLIIKLLIEFGRISIQELIDIVFNKYNYKISEATIKSCILNLNFEFIREIKNGQLCSLREIYNLNIVKYENNMIYLTTQFSNELLNPIFKKYLLDSTEFSIHIFDKLFTIENWNSGFVLYRKYSRKDVFRILNVDENPVAQNVGGYLVNNESKHCPIFVNYHKDESISDSTKYEDFFVNNNEFEWMSKSNRTLNSPDVKSILGKNGQIRLLLFIKKNNDEGMDFYYMGDIKPQLNNVIESKMPNNSSVVKIRFDLINSVPDSLFKYLNEK
jgi:superfamily II DNA or RNA helicase/HKD family nuclease